MAGKKIKLNYGIFFMWYKIVGKKIKEMDLNLNLKKIQNIKNSINLN